MYIHHQKVKNMKNILIISTNLKSRGGIATVVNNIITSELSNTYKFIYLSTHTNGNVFKKLFYLIKSYLAYPFILIFNDISLAHIHGGMKISFFRKSYFLIVGKLFGKKVIYHMHSAMVEEYMQRCNFIKAKLVKKIFNMYDAIIVISNYWSGVLSKLTQKPVILLYNSIPISQALTKRNESAEKLKIFTMGELGKRKGTYDIIEAIKYIQNNNIIIELYGDGDVQKCEKLINDNNLQERIKIKGWISGNDKGEVFKNSDIYILPSYNEGLPMSILEAMSYGLPVISTPVGGIPEAVEDGVNGFLIQPGDAKALAEKIDILASDKELREKMGQKSYEIAKEKFDINVIIRQLQGIYDELLTN